MAEELHIKYPHYYKKSPTNIIDIYRVLLLFEVDDPCIAHAVKKLLVPGNRSAGKTQRQDIEEAIASLQRCLALQDENNKADPALKLKEDISVDVPPGLWPIGRRFKFKNLSTAVFSKNYDGISKIVGYKPKEDGSFLVKLVNESTENKFEIETQTLRLYGVIL